MPFYYQVIYSPFRLKFLDVSSNVYFVWQIFNKIKKHDYKQYEIFK